MSRMKKLTVGLLVGFIVVGIAIYLVYSGAFVEDLTRGVERAETNDAEATTEVVITAQDTVVVLSGENTRVGFVGSSGLGNQPGFFRDLQGRVVFAADGSIKALSATIDLISVVTQAETLTEKLKNEPGFFNVAQYPQSSFVLTEIAPDETGDATYRVTGNLTLKGNERSISFPMTATPTADGVTLASEFAINRMDFDVDYDGGAQWPAIREQVLIKLSLDLSHSATSTEDDASFAEGLEQVAPSAVDAPASFIETIPDSLAEFKMVLVPGDPSRGIEPFYIGQHEVTWDEFGFFAFCEDVDEFEAVDLRDAKLRPSPPWDQVDRGYGTGQRPAIGMSLLSAQMYCKWLSERTGRQYRLPTMQEWLYAYELGRLAPEPGETEAQRLGWFEDNADEMTHPVGQKAADALGLYDMLGNVSEWVDTGAGEDGDRIALGGHFRTSASEASASLQTVEDWTWNENYPNEPPSEWWFVDADYVGFRVVCDP